MDRHVGSNVATSRHACLHPLRLLLCSSRQLPLACSAAGPCTPRARPPRACPCAPPAAGRRPAAAGRPSLPTGATTVRPPFLTRPAGAARGAPALPARALRARHWAAAAAQSLGRRSWCPCARPRGRPRGRRLLGHGLPRAAIPDLPAHGRRPACTPSSHRRQCRDREFEDPGRCAPAIEGGGAGPAAVVPGRSPVRATWRCCRPHHAACGAVRRCWRLDLPPASGEAAREASGGRDGACMAHVGVRRASPAGRRTGSGGEEAARRRTVAAGGASTPEALHDEAKGRVRAQIGRGEGGGAVGARNR